MPIDLETVERLLRLSGIVALAYIILMGVTYRAGVKYGTRIAQRQREREGKPSIRELLRSESPGAFWKDEALVRYGVRVTALMLFIFAGTVAAMVLNPPLKQELPGAISVMIAFANVWFAVCVYTSILVYKPLRRSFDPRLFGIAVGSVICAAATLLTPQRFIPRGLEVGAVQVLGYLSLIFVFQSLLLAYQSGVTDSFEEADIEQRLPIVEVHTVGGETISGLRMKSISEAEYRFIRQDGMECLIPSAQVRMIRVVVPVGTTDITDEVKPGRVVGQGRG